MRTAVAARQAAAAPKGKSTDEVDTVKYKRGSAGDRTCYERHVHSGGWVATPPRMHVRDRAVERGHCHDVRCPTEGRTSVEYEGFCAPREER